MLAYLDFIPSHRDRFMGLTVGFRESLDDTLVRANQWVHDKKVDVINVETVLLPAEAIKRAESSAGSEIEETRYNIGMFEFGSNIVQIVRVWYRNQEAH